MKRELAFPIFVFAFLILLGTILTLIFFGKYEPKAIVSVFVAGVCSSIIATSIVALFTFLWVSPRTNQEIIQSIKDIIGTPVKLYDQRQYLNQHYSNLESGAIEIDIISLTSKAFFNNVHPKDLAEWIKGGKRIRILVLSPKSASCKIRAKQEEIDLGHKIIETIKINFRSLCRELKKTGESNVTGSLEARFYDGIPYFAYFRADHKILLGFYYSHRLGLHSEAIMLNKEGKDERISKNVFSHLHDNFEWLWLNSKEQKEKSLICYIDNHRNMYNESLIQNLERQQ